MDPSSPHHPFNALIKTKLVEMRTALGMNQRDFAKLIKRSQNWVARLEGGDRKVGLLEFYWLCQACERSPIDVVLELFASFEEKS